MSSQVLDYHLSAYHPILAFPTPPFHALTLFVSAYNETGVNDPVGKYGPTGHKIANIRALPEGATPSEGCGENKTSF